ncbi:MAG: cell division protein ZapA, partial [Bacteroidia bacterium]|nr:cell division protein ZapA [Bacteroidia bacterium]
MKETSISISIAGNSYPVKVKPEDEQVIVKAARLINDKIKALKETYVVSDKRDLLAMCALQLATQNIQLESKTDSDNVQLADRLVEMESFI